MLMPFLRYKRTLRQPFGWRFTPRQSKKYNKNNSNGEKKKNNSVQCSLSELKVKWKNADKGKTR